MSTFFDQPEFRNQSEAARILETPEPTLRSWIRKFRPYVIQRPGDNGNPAYEIARLRELHYVCAVWAKGPPRRSMEEVGRELARRYPVEARAGGVKLPPEPDFDHLAPTGPALRAPLPPDTLAALALLPEALAGFPDALSGLQGAATTLGRATTCLETIPGGIERALATTPPRDAALLAAIQGELGELKLVVVEMKGATASLAGLAPLLARQVEAAELTAYRAAEAAELQRAILDYLEVRGRAGPSPWRWLWPSFWLTLVLTVLRPAEDDEVDTGSGARTPRDQRQLAARTTGPRPAGQGLPVSPQEAP